MSCSVEFTFLVLVQLSETGVNGQAKHTLSLSLVFHKSEQLYDFSLSSRWLMGFSLPLNCLGLFNDSADVIAPFCNSSLLSCFLHFSAVITVC